MLAALHLRAADEIVTYLTGPVSRLRILSNGLLLAALVLGFIVVVTSDGGARTGSDSAIASIRIDRPPL